MSKGFKEATACRDIVFEIGGPNERI